MSSSEIVRVGVEEAINSVDDFGDLDLVALDVDMMSVLQNRNLKGDEKWLQYYRALERFLYKKDPTFKPLQFKLEAKESSDGSVRFVIKNDKKGKKKYLKYVPAVLFPLLGTAFTLYMRHG